MKRILYLLSLCTIVCGVQASDQTIRPGVWERAKIGMGTLWRNAREKFGGKWIDREENGRRNLEFLRSTKTKRRTAAMRDARERANVAAQQWLRPGVEESPNYDWAGTDEQFNTPYRGQGLTTPQVQGAWDRFKGALGRYWTPISKRKRVFSDPIAEARRLERFKRERDLRTEAIEQEPLNNPSLAAERATRKVVLPTEEDMRERYKARELIEQELLNNPLLATERATRGYEWRRDPKDDWFYDYILQEPDELKGKPVGTVYYGKYSDGTPFERRVPSKETELRTKIQLPSAYWQE
jgi:hypothetical protein